MEPVQSGDSVLAPHNHTFLRANPIEDGRSVAESAAQSDWQMASLNFLLPREVTPDQGEISIIILCRRFSASYANMICDFKTYPGALTGPLENASVPDGGADSTVPCLSAEAAARIVAGAGQSAQDQSTAATEGEALVKHPYWLRSGCLYAHGPSMYDGHVRQTVPLILLSGLSCAVKSGKKIISQAVWSLKTTLHPSRGYCKSSEGC